LRILPSPINCNLIKKTNAEEQNSSAQPLFDIKTLDKKAKKLYNCMARQISRAKYEKEVSVLAEKGGHKIIAQNKKAYHDYFVDEKYEAGIELFGTEVKSLRAGQVNLKDSYIDVKDGELFVVGMHVSPYEHGNIFNRDPLRKRRLLMHKREIMKLHGLVSQKGVSLIPLSLYFSGSRVKVEVGLCRGKKLYDKRDSIAKHDADREIERRMKDRSN
jgi:SsrA-binding protein